VFDSIGWGEIVVLALAALFIFGPDRLPGLAKEAAGALKHIRTALRDARGQVTDNLGEEFDDLRELDPRHYSPKTFLRDQLLKDD
jgi:sec-independent protein translocase protein TatB